MVGMWLTIGMGLMGAFLPSLKVNPLDLSPNYAGSLMAIVGGTGAVSGIVTPILVGKLTAQVSHNILTHRYSTRINIIVLADLIRASSFSPGHSQGTMSEWRLVFWISAAILVMTNFVYVIFGSAKAESWNYIRSPVNDEQPDKTNEKERSRIDAIKEERA